MTKDQRFCRILRLNKLLKWLRIVIKEVSKEMFLLKRYSKILIKKETRQSMKELRSMDWDERLQSIPTTDLTRQVIFVFLTIVVTA